MPEISGIGYQSSCFMIKRQIGLIQQQEDGTETEAYLATVDSDQDQKISCGEAWSFFLRNIDIFPEENVKTVVDSIVKEIEENKDPKKVALLGQLAFFSFTYVKGYKDLLIKISQSDNHQLRMAGMAAMKMFDLAEAVDLETNPIQKSAAVQSSGLNLDNLLPHYNFLNMFDANHDLVLDGKDHPLFSNVSTPQEAEAIVLANLGPLSQMPGVLSINIASDQLPKNYIKATIATVVEAKTGEKRIAIIDGDTIRLDSDLDHNGKPDGVRFKGVNTPEFGKGPNLKSRKKKADPGAIAAWEQLNALLATVNYEVYVAPEKFDAYGRFVSQVFIKAGDKYIDIEAHLASEGLGMVYFIQIDEAKGSYERYISCLLLQAAAQQNKRGLWALPEFQDKNDPKGEGFRLLYITSFHPNAKRDKYSSDFLASEFGGKLTVESLCQAIEADNYGIDHNSPLNTLEWLNEILVTQNFYKLWLKKHPDIQLDEKTLKLVEETKKYRSKPFDQLSEYQQKKVKLLNRLLLDAAYPTISPRNGSKDIDEPLYNEYIRVVNTSGKPLDLAGYKIFNKVSGETIEMPHFILPPGRTLKIASGDIKTNSDPANELVYSLGRTTDFWDEEGVEGVCLVIKNPNGDRIDSSAKYKYEGCK